VVKDGRAPAWVVLPWMLGLGRQCQCCCAHTQYPRRPLVPGDVSAAQKKMSRRSKAVVVREFADQITGSKKAPLQARRPYQNPPSLIRATAAMHQYPQSATPQQPRIRTISNRRWSLQALVFDTSACQIVNTWPTQPGTQLWPKLMFPGTARQYNLQIPPSRVSCTPLTLTRGVTNRCCRRCLSLAAR
jgi:hypothetical protein